MLVLVGVCAWGLIAAFASLHWPRQTPLRLGGAALEPGDYNWQTSPWMPRVPGIREFPGLEPGDHFE